MSMRHKKILGQTIQYSQTHYETTARKKEQKKHIIHGT